MMVGKRYVHKHIKHIKNIGTVVSCKMIAGSIDYYGFTFEPGILFNIFKNLKHGIKNPHGEG